ELGTPPGVDDSIACKDDSCDEQTDSIVHAPDDDFCANGSFCDGDELCNAQTGCEAGTPPGVDDAIACTDDSCDEGADLVVHMPDASLCDDGNICTAESCDEVSGCLNDPIVDCTFEQVPALSNWGLGALLLLLSAAGLTAQARRRCVTHARVRR
ncbi:MAG: IPTL-CTERM sorting domain-containing protein, partial [Myxococcota bacterium]